MRPRKTIAILSLLGISVFIFLSVVDFSYAFVRIDNMKVKLTIAPGETTTGQTRIENPSADTITVKVYLEDWYYVLPGNGDKKFMPPGTTSFSCASWINFAPSEFTMPPFSSRVLSFSVSMPEDVREGRYAVMFFETVPVVAENEGINVMIATRIGSLFYIEPEGFTDDSAELSNLSVKKQSAGQGLEISLDYKNTGNVAQVMEKGNFSIIDRQGKVYARGRFNDIYTFPQDSVKLTSKWKTLLPDGKYDLVITLTKDNNQVIVREAEIEIGALGKVLGVGQLR